MGHVRSFLEVSFMRCPRCQNLTDAKPLFCGCGYCLDPGRRRRDWAALVSKLALYLVCGGGLLAGAVYLFCLAAYSAVLPGFFHWPMAFFYGCASLLLFRRFVKVWLQARATYVDSREALSRSLS